MNWILGIFKKIAVILTDIAESIWKSISNRYKKPDGKIAEVSTVKKFGKVLLALMVVGVVYRIATNNQDNSMFDKYNSENKTPFKIGKPIGNDGAADELKANMERELRSLGKEEISPNSNSTESSSGLFNLTTSVNKFSCSEIVKKIQRSEVLSSEERVFFGECFGGKFIDTPKEVTNIYPKISDKENPLDSVKSKNTIDAVLSGDESDKKLLATANEAISSPTGSKAQDFSFKILDKIPAMKKEDKAQFNEMTRTGNMEAAEKLIDSVKMEADKANTDGTSNTPGVVQGNEGNNPLNETNKLTEEEVNDINKKSNEAAEILKQKEKAEKDLGRIESEIDAYNLPAEKRNEIEGLYSNIDPNLKGEALAKAEAEAFKSCLEKLSGDPRANEICSKFKKQAELRRILNVIKERELSFTNKTKKSPFEYLSYALKIRDVKIAVNSARFISQGDDYGTNGDDIEDINGPKEDLSELDKLLKNSKSIDPDIYRTRRLLESKKDNRTNATNITGIENALETQSPVLKVSDTLVYSSKDTKGITFPVNVKIPAVLAETIYVSDQSLSDKPIHLRIKGDVFNPLKNKIIVHKGATLSGRATSMDVDTKTLTVSFNKISDGPISDDIQLTVTIKGAAWDTKGKQITSAVLVDYATSILDKVTSDSKGDSADQVLLDVINQSSVTAATSAVQKVAQQLATDLQNAKKLFFAPEGARIIIYP